MEYPHEKIVFEFCQFKVVIVDFGEPVDVCRRFENSASTHIPYVLVMLADYPPWTGTPARGTRPGREFWYRFWFLDTERALDA
ncbi:hypothetical protein OS035_32165 [Rhizobium sp. 268]|uniref:hypothetical protein n=1 Tax=Rhizobium sp. 268 TaxID=2996375 RepID=UPI002F93834A